MPYGTMSVAILIDCVMVESFGETDHPGYPLNWYRNTFGPKRYSIINSAELVSGDTLPETFTTSSGSDHNSAMMRTLRKQRKKTLIYKKVYTPFGSKVRRWDFSKDRYVNGRTWGWAWRIRTVWSKIPRSSFEKKLKTNSLDYFQCNMVASPESYTLVHDSSLLHYIEEELETQWVSWTDVISISGKFVLYAISKLEHQFASDQWFKGIIPLYPLIVVDDYRREDHFSDEVSGEIELCEQIALARLYKLVRRQSVDLATGLAELAQTTGMISAAALHLAKSFLLLKAGRVGAAFASLFPSTKKETAGVFLAYRYGVSPLLSDIDGAVQHLAELVQNFQPVYARSKSKKDIVFEDETVINPDNSVVNTVSRSIKVTVRYHVTYGLGDALLNNLSRLGFTSPRNVAWELVPFSFVIDWFYPIGQYLGLLGAFEGLELKEMHKTVIVKETVKCVAPLPVGFAVHEGALSRDSWRFEEETCSWTIENVSVKREIINVSDPTFLPALRRPRFKNPFSSGHVANAIALVLQVFSRK